MFGQHQASGHNPGTTMKARFSLCLLGVLAAVAALLISGARDAAAAPQAPVPVAPGEGESIAVPAFSWQGAAGAVRYEVEVGPLNDPNAVSWSAQTVNRTVTPVAAAKFANGVYYWRVRAKDAGGAAGSWSKRIRFSLSIPVPALNVPAVPEGTFTSSAPTLEWRTKDVRPPSYMVEVSASPSFLPLEATYTTYNERLTPVNTLAHGAHYWRVRGVDAAGHTGAPSAIWKMATGLEAPRVVQPAADGRPRTPQLEWTAVNGAATYKVELSDSSTFKPVLATYTTYNLGITPVKPLRPGTHYWRVSGVDAGGHVGASSVLSFVLWSGPTVANLQLAAPADQASVKTDPTFRWSCVPHSAYRLIVSRYPDFHETYDSVDTHYETYTPYSAGSKDVYADGIYYWRVEAQDSNGKLRAASATRSFTKRQPPTLSAPAGAAVLTVDPTFVWERVVGAQRYRLIVSKYADFHAAYDSVVTEYNTYTPYTPGARDAYANGVYYWKVEALSGGNVVAASTPRKFTKAQPLLLSDPADGAKGSGDPTFVWGQVAGAQRYRLIVSKYADFHALFDSVNCDYNRYTPYAVGPVGTYPAGTYFWKVEARSSEDVVITTSKVWRFTIGSP